jgi:hypothetical membrane protein
MSLLNPAVPATARAPYPAPGARRLLVLGGLAGPLYVAVSLVQSVTRDGFDPARHAWSMLTNGDLGWIHITNLIVSGALVIAGAVGLNAALRTGPGAIWAPRLLAVYGGGMVLAGMFRADPGRGFPPGNPDEVEVSWHGTVHFAVAGVGFLALVAACFVLARRFRTAGRPGWALFSVATGTCYLASFAALSGSGGSGWAILAFTAGVVLAAIWMTMVLVRYSRGR